MDHLLYDQGKRYEDLIGEAIWNIEDLFVGDHVMFGPHTWSFKVIEVDDNPQLTDERIIATMEIADPFVASMYENRGGVTVHMYETGMLRLRTGHEIENFRRVETPVGPW